MKSINELLELDKDGLREYFARAKLSRASLLLLFAELGIRYSQKAQGPMVEALIHELGDTAMYRRIAGGTAK